MSATPDAFLFRVSCMYFHQCEGCEKPDHDWLDALFEKHRPTMLVCDDDLDRLRYVLCRISHEALHGSAGSRPSAKQREKVSKCLQSVDTAYARLWDSIEEIPLGFRPHWEHRRDQQLTAVEQWLADQGQGARARGNAKDHWRDTLFTTLLGFYDLAYGLHWRELARRRGGEARSGEIIGGRKAPATFVRAYLTAVQNLLRSCDFIPETEGAALKDRWFVPRIAALTDKMETFRRGDLECTTWEPPRVLGSTSVRTLSDDRPRIVSVAQKIWLEAGGRIPDATQSG